MSTLNDPSAYLAKHYVYEINMLRQVYQALPDALASRDNSPREECIANALIESFCIHARVLRDFYSRSQKGKKDDVLATDFATSWQASTTATSQLAKDVDLKERMDKQIAHLTTGRENPTKKFDDVDQQALLKAIEADHADFMNAVGPQYANCFAKKIQVTPQDYFAQSITGPIGPLTVRASPNRGTTNQIQIAGTKPGSG